MWCRALLLVIALTCTLQREIIAEPDDVLCVIYLSGLQTEDLSGDLLKKLQRHNINIDDLNDEKTIKKCFQNASPNRNATSTNKSLSTTNDQTEQTTPRTVNLSRITKINHNNQSQNVSTSVKRDTLKTDIENFINFWLTLKNSTDQQIENKTAKEINNTQIVPLKTFNEQNKIDFQSNDLDLFNKLFGNYISAAQAITSTLKPTSTQKHINIIKTTNFIKTNENTNAIQPRTNINAESLLCKKNSLFSGLFGSYQSNLSGAQKCNTEDEKQVNDSAIETNQDLIEELSATFNKVSNNNTHPKNIDFIKKMIDSYQNIAAKLALTTLKPTTTEKDFESMSKQIKDITADNVLEGRVSEPFENGNGNVNQSYNTSDHESLTLKTDSKLNELFRQQFLLNMFSPLKSNIEDKELLNLLIEQTRSNLNKNTELDSQLANAKFVKKVFERYIAAKLPTTTIKPPTTKKNFGSTSQNIQGFMENNNNDYIKAFIKYVSESSGNGNINDKMTLFLNKYPTLNDLLKTKYQLNMATPLQNNIQIKEFEQSQTVKLDSNSYEHIPTTTITYPSDIDFRTMNIEDIKKILDSYIEAKQALAVTLKSTTTEKQIDILSQRIKEFFKTNNYKNIGSQVAKPPKIENDNVHTPQKMYSVEPQTQRKMATVQYINELVDKKNQSIYDPLKGNVYDGKTLDDTSHIIQRTSAPMQKPIVLNKEINVDPLSKNLSVYKMIEIFLATNHAQTSTTIPTTTQEPFDLISQKIKEFLEKNSNDYIKNQASITQVSERDQKQKRTKQEPLLYFRKNINKPRQGSQIDIFDAINSNTTGMEKFNNTQNVQISKPSVHDTNNTMITEIKPLPDDIIQEITQKLKVSILEDLKKEIASTMNSTAKESTTTAEMTVTIRTALLNAAELDNFIELLNKFKNETAMENTTETTTTDTLLQIDQVKINTATSALENVMELFQQFKNIEGMGDPKYALTQKKHTKNEFHGPINVLSLLPANYAYVVKTQTAKPLPIYVNRYQNLNINNHVLQTSHSVQERENEKLRLQARLDELSDFNLNTLNMAGNKMNERPPLQSAAIIQTDAVEVPLLGIPVPKSVRAINQNIVVTTKHPMLQFNEEQKYRNFRIGHKPRYEDYKSRNEKRFGVKKQSNLFKEKKYHTNSHRQSDSDIEIRYRTELERYSDTDTDRRYTDLEGQLKTYYEKRSHTDLERPYEQGHAYLQHGRHSKPPLQSKTVNKSQKSRTRQNFNFDNFYQEYISRLRPKSGNSRLMLSSKHPKERFHEKLERPVEKENNFGKRQNSSREDKRLKVASRQQLSLNKIKKGAVLDDTHYQNFLKTQEKVNSMLEKILTQRDEGVRSVETPD